MVGIGIRGILWKTAAANEVEALWQGHAKTLVHSQEFVDWEGLEYDRILKVLNAKPKLQAEELAMLSALSASYNQERTGSAVVLDRRFDALIQAVDQWSLALIAGLPQYQTEILWALRQAQHFEEAEDEKDLIHLAQLLKLNLPDARIRAASAQVEAAAQASLLHAWHRTDYPEANGISITALAHDDPHRVDYFKSSFAQRTHWDEFLQVLWHTR